jgi:hypothetical protein
MVPKNAPNDASATSTAEGDRWKSDSETVERYDQTVESGDKAGISNRPLDEELENQASLPERGTRKEEDDR